MIQAEFILDVFDADISPEMLSMYENDEIPVSSTPDIIDNLSATPDQVNHIARTIKSQFDYLNPAFDEMTFSLDNAAEEFRHFILNEDSYRLLGELSRHINIYQEYFRTLAEAENLYAVIRRIEPGSQFLHNHPELRTSFEMVCFVLF